MSPTLLKCPRVGHKAFETSLPHIIVGSANNTSQISKVIRPHTCVLDDLQLQHPPGELQRMDLADVPAMFAHHRFVLSTIERNRAVFQTSACCVFQFQTITSAGVAFVFGTFITDGDRNLIDYCVDTALAHKRRPVLHTLMRAVCTSSSVARRLDH